MNIKEEEIVLAFDKSKRNRYIKLFEYYKDLFTNKDYLATDIAYKINANLGIQITYTSIKYIRSRIMRKRLVKPNGFTVNSSKVDYTNGNLHKEDTIENFKFNEPQSIDHNQEIVTFRKRKT